MKKTTIPKIKITIPIEGMAYRGVCAIGKREGVEIILMARNKEELQRGFEFLFRRAEYYPAKSMPLLLVKDNQP